MNARNYLHSVALPGYGRRPRRIPPTSVFSGRFRGARPAGTTTGKANGS